MIGTQYDYPMRRAICEKVSLHLKEFYKKLPLFAKLELNLEKDKG